MCHLLVWLLVAPGSATAGPDTILTREEEARLKAEEAEREALVQRVYRERLLQIPPETFHAPHVDTARPVLGLVEDLLFLELATRLLEHGGVENIDRLREAAQTWRGRAIRDAARSREALADRLRPTEAERADSARSGLSLEQVLARNEEKPADARPGVAAAQPAAAPLDYIPVRPEDLNALRDRYMASGQSVDENWYARLARDPVAEKRWKEQQRAHETNVARLQTAWATEHGASYQIGTWLQDTWHRKDPLGLAIIAVILLGLAGVVWVAFKLLRRDR